MHKDPAPQLTTVRTLGDKHARINPDYNESKRARDLWHILADSAKQTPFVNPLYVNVIRDLRAGAPFSFSTLCLRVRTVWKEELAFATPADTSSSGGGGGGDRQKQPTFNSVTVDKKPGYSIKVAAGGASAQSVVVTDEQPDPAPADPEPAGSLMTFIAPVPDPPPPLDHAAADSDADVAEPAAKPHPADMASHPASGDFTYEAEPVAMHAVLDDDEDWPAYRSTPWIPSIGTSTGRQAPAWN
ncbi:hypothetical protein CYMTET_50952 [Cymbomonas tetramitiformis]|uniref:Uncharacterized protein n=1 Tax=Cymbomonas tetramitiformis TaxID=36881 RepID=A0AAE0ESM5_9CHLO|nr:hypothetical protein CYMTET_50952 [Cymbomonas tetramitiformis]